MAAGAAALTAAAFLAASFCCCAAAINCDGSSLSSPPRRSKGLTVAISAGASANGTRPGSEDSKRPTLEQRRDHPQLDRHETQALKIKLRARVLERRRAKLRKRDEEKNPSRNLSPLDPYINKPICLDLFLSVFYYLPPGLIPNYFFHGLFFNDIFMHIL